MRAPATRGLSITVVVALGAKAWAQISAPPPPRILDEEPGEAILAELPEDRQEVLEEVVVIGEAPWRLPDLGTVWRAENPEPRESRLAVRFLPLYDPELEDRSSDIFVINKQQERLGYLELFRIRFGAEPQQTATPTVTDPDP